jgi:Fe-S-cluster-containing hydrogenase component 2
MIEVLHRLCRVCDACIAVCPTLALLMEGDRLVWTAHRCGDDRSCLAVCPASALVLHPQPTAGGGSPAPPAAPRERGRA